MDYRLKQLINERVPKGRETLSRDAAEILMQLAWEEAQRALKADQAEQEREDRHGPMFI